MRPPSEAFALWVFVALLALCVAVGAAALISAGFDTVTRLILPASC